MQRNPFSYFYQNLTGLLPGFMLVFLWFFMAWKDLHIPWPCGPRVLSGSHESHPAVKRALCVNHSAAMRAIRQSKGVTVSAIRQSKELRWYTIRQSWGRPVDIWGLVCDNPSHKTRKTNETYTQIYKTAKAPIPERWSVRRSAFAFFYMNMCL